MIKRQPIKTLKANLKAPIVLDGSGNTGTDKIMDVPYFAVPFSVAEEMTFVAFAVKLKASATLTEDYLLIAQVWPDDGGEPGTFVGSTQTDLVNADHLFTSFEIYKGYGVRYHTLAPGDYWLVLRTWNTPIPVSGNILLDAENSQAIKKSSDGITWSDDTGAFYFQFLGDAGNVLNALTETNNAIVCGSETMSALYAETGGRNQAIIYLILRKGRHNTGITIQNQGEGVALGLYSFGSGDCLECYRFAGSGKVGNFINAIEHPALECGVMSDGSIVDLQKFFSTEGSITVAGSVVSYNGFSGAHFFQLNVGQEESDFSPGMVLVSTGEIIPCEASIVVIEEKIQKKLDEAGITIPEPVPATKEYFPYVAKTSTQADKCVIGVFAGKIAESADKGLFGQNDKALFNYMSLGFGRVRVTDTNGNIENGDYLQSSTRAGEAEKQTSDSLHNYTTAKALVGVDFATIDVDPTLGYKWTLAPCSLHCG